MVREDGILLRDVSLTFVQLPRLSSIYGGSSTSSTNAPQASVIHQILIWNSFFPQAVCHSSMTLVSSQRFPEKEMLTLTYQPFGCDFKGNFLPRVHLGEEQALWVLEYGLFGDQPLPVYDRMYFFRISQRIPSFSGFHTNQASSFLWVLWCYFYDRFIQ